MWRFSLYCSRIFIIGMTTFLLSSSVYPERGSGNAYMQSQAVCVTRFDQSEYVICRVIFALGRSRFQRYTW